MWKLIRDQISSARGLANQLVIQVSAVFGAMALISFFDQMYQIIFIIDLDLRGFLEPIAIFWQENFRPAVRLVFEPILIGVSKVFGVKIEIPGIVLDYLSVGFTLVLSRWRGAVGGWRGGVRKATKSVLRRPLRVVVMLLRTVFLWPFVVVELARNLFLAQRLFPDRSAEEIVQIRFSHFLALLPVFLAILLALANLIYVALIAIAPKRS